MNENILNSQWIPTKVRSPDKDGYYLVTIKGLGTNNDYIHIYKFAKDLNKVNRDDFRVKKVHLVGIVMIANMGIIQ